MKRNAIILSAAATIATIVTLAQAQGESVRADDLTFLGQPVASEQIVRGQTIYADNCASCHGANLEGQPNWKRRLDNGRMPAPPHDESGHTWHHSDQDLFAITKLGVGGVIPGYESDMFAFGEVLSDEEIADVLAFIKSTWPGRQQDVQARISIKDGGGS